MGTMIKPKHKWAICDCCQGNGRIDNPAFSNGFTSDEWLEMDIDERENYLIGAYDVPCHQCKGSGKVQVPDLSQMTFSEKRQLAAERRESRMQAEIDREFAAIEAAERRFGC